MARRALITGLSGFTGRHMAVELMNAGYDVWGTTTPSPEGDVPDTVGIPVDLLDAEALKSFVTDARPDVVVHLAGAAHVTGNPPGKTYMVNIVGTRNLLAALTALDKKPRAVLLASTANVYGNASVETIDEDVAIQPANDYAVSKLAMEHAARLWIDRLPLIFVRPFNYTGVGQSEDYVLPKIVGHHARREARISLGNLNVSRDFSDVRDVVATYAKLVQAAPVGETFNICSGHSHSLGQMLQMLSRIAGYEIDVFVDPRFMRRNEISKLVGSNRKLRQAIGHVPHTPISDTLEWMYDHMSAQVAV
ncbi:UDP-glucose 4-epimerase [Caballeronia peredens]|nr:UDP-glucose 4-epimerase [Caballeronia peredens]